MREGQSRRKRQERQKVVFRFPCQVKELVFYSRGNEESLRGSYTLQGRGGQLIKQRFLKWGIQPCNKRRKD